MDEAVNCSSCIYFQKNRARRKSGGECTNEFRQTQHPAYYNNTRNWNSKACKFYRRCNA